MKKTATIFIVLAMLTTSVGVSFAEEWFSDDSFVPQNNGGYVAPSNGTVFYNNDQNVSGGSGSNNYGNTFYSDSSYVAPAVGSTAYNYDTNCLWCNNLTTSSTNYGNTFYSDSSYVAPAVGSTAYNHDTNCTWCSQPTYTSTPASNVSGGYSYTPVYNTQPTYGTTYGQVYTTPSIGQIGYIGSGTTIIPGNTTTICSDGSIPSPTTGCNRTNTIPVNTTNLCSDGSTPDATNGCNRTNTIPVNTSTVCADGQAPSSTTGCNRTTYIPVNTTTLCADGSLPSYNGCTRTTIVPIVQYINCNGVSIPSTQSCYYPAPVTPYIPITYPAPQVIKFNNVVTSLPTQITTTSARCNGIGLIANSAASNGWFEYGETANLGRVTQTVNIGNAATSPFSNMLASLKPATTYYCRAVMQNQYGTVKGETVKFTTKATQTVYVKPVTVKHTAKTPAKKSNAISCSDGSSLTVGSTQTVGIINNGQKLVAIQIEKVDGTLIENTGVTYRVLFKNLSDTALMNVNVRVMIPQEFAITNVSAGSYDTTTHMVTLNIGTLQAYQEGAITWSGKVLKGSQVGKSVVTTAYLAYTIVSAKGQSAQDEVTAYTVSSIAATPTLSEVTGQHVIGSDESRGFLPQSLVEWLALIAILFIIFILGRSIIASYKGEKDAHH